MSDGSGGSSQNEAASTVFVGSISPGVSDRWLVQLFQACGGYRSFKRVSKAFGFADFSTLRDALRVLAVLHDLELPSMGSERGKPTKKLIVRADEKTSAFLGEFEKTMVRTDADSLQDAAARARVDYVIQAMSNPNAESGDEPERYEIPSHLKDLSMSEIPVNRRKHVLSEIEKFRLGAVASDAADRKRELELERQRAAALAMRHSSPMSTSGSATPLSKMRDTPDASDHTSTAADDPEVTDERNEADRQRVEASRRAHDARQAEHAYLEREQARLATWAEHTLTENASARSMEAWLNLDEDTELARESFWTDRRRWIQRRAEARRREEEADRADRDAEKAENAEAKRQADAFLAELAPMAAGHAPGAPSSAPTWRPSSGAPPLKLHVRQGEMLPGVQRRLDLEQKMRDAPDHAHVIQLVQSLPRTELWGITPAWTRVDLAHIAPTIDAGIAASFGESVPDLQEAVLDKLREHANAQDVADVLEPVLDDEAADVVDQVWRALLLPPP